VLVVANPVAISPILVTLMIEALNSYETSVLIRATQRNIPEDAILPATLDAHISVVSGHGVTDVSTKKEAGVCMCPTEAHSPSFVSLDLVLEFLSLRRVLERKEVLASKQLLLCSRVGGGGGSAAGGGWGDMSLNGGNQWN
jgi:hypothetical protein